MPSSPTQQLPFKIASSLTFPPFSPGHEYKKSLSIQNTFTSSTSDASGPVLYVKIVKTPENAAFDIPSFNPTAPPIKIRPGLQKTIHVRFRPVNEAEETMRDEIVLQVWQGDGVTAKRKLRGARTASMDQSMESLASTHLAATSLRPNAQLHRIRLKAIVPKISVDISPRQVDFGLCAVRDTVEQQVCLIRREAHHAAPQERIKFQWYLENESIFSIEPKVGELHGDKMQLMVRFRPQEAMTALASAVCCINGEKDPSLILKMSGIGKYSFLTLNKNALDFGDVLVNQTTKKSFEICNKSLVGSQFSVHRIVGSPSETSTQGQAPSVFSFKPSSGYIEAEGKSTIQVTYAPHTNESIDNETFEIRTLDTNVTNKRRLLCEGRALGPHVSIVGGSNVINFGDVNVGKPVQRVLELKNHSPIYVEVEIVDAHRVEASTITKPNAAPLTFKFTTASIAPNSSVKIPVSFTLQAPINYYERYYISVRNQKALYIDVIGNGHTDTEFPAPLNLNHVYAYRERCALGMALSTPEDLNSLIQQQNDTSELSQQDIDMLSKFENSLVDHAIVTSDAQLMDDFFTDPSSKKHDRPVSLDVSSLSFGKTSSFKLSNVYQVVRVKNRTSSKMTCRPLVPAINGGQTPSPFVVFPEEGVDIKPQSYCEFRIGFRPQEENQFYQQTVDFLCSYKIQRSFRLVNPQTIVPPFMLKLQVSGNTYSDPGSLAPKPFLAPNRLVSFPSLLVHEVGYQTIVLRNAGDVPLPFRVELTTAKGGVPNVDSASPNGTISAFSVSPAEGQVEPGAFRLVTFRFKPTVEKLYQCKASFFFNTTNQNKKILSLMGHGCVPKLAYGNDTSQSQSTTTQDNKSKSSTPQHTLLLKPAHVGASSRRSLLIRNPTRIPVSYRWNIPQEASQELRIEPASGILAPNADFECSATFSPLEMTRLTTQISCEILCDTLGPSQMPTPLLFKVLGEATKGTCQMEPSEFNFGFIRVGADPATTKITLLNSGDCDLPYELVFCNRDENGDLIVEASQELSCADASQRRGVIPARSYIFVSVEYKPRARKYSQIAAICCLPLQAGQSGFNASDSQDVSRTIYPIPYDLEHLEKFPSCELEGIGSMPQLGITDIYSRNTPKTNLWHQFSVNQINDTLLEIPDRLPPAAKDIAFHTYIKHLKRFLLDFGAKTIGQDDTTVFVQLENIGNIEAEFSLSFCNDSSVEVDRWAEDQGTRTEAQERELYLILNDIFTISPKRATLQPGERVTVQLNYQHKLAEVHSVPLVMKVHNSGTNIVLDLTGQTLNIDQVLLHFRSLQHWFEPVQIGTRQPPIQYYELKNSSDLQTRYTVDTSVLDDFSADNFGFTVLDLENPQGVLPANGLALLKFVFNPLEAKDYHLELPISVQNGDTYFIHFYGKGVEKHAVKIGKESEQQQKSDSSDEAAEEQSQGESRTLVQTPHPPGTVQPIPHQVPDLQTISFPNQLARFSLDVLYFGNVPTFSVHKRLIAINNISETDTLRFDWQIQLPQFPERGVTSTTEVEPSSGLVEPGDFVVCKVTYTAGSVPEHLNCDIVCSVVSESERLRKEERRLCYEDEIKNIHDEDTELVSPQSSPVVRKKVPRKSVVERSVRETTAKSINFISYRSSAEQLSNEYLLTRPTMRNENEDDDKYGLKVLRVSDVKVRLNAHVWDIETFKDVFPEKHAKQHVPQIQSIVKEITKMDDDHAPPIRKQMDAMGKDFLAQFLQDVLQEVLQHDSIVCASTNVKAIQTPYYAEFADVPPLENPADKAAPGDQLQSQDDISEDRSQEERSEEEQNDNGSSEEDVPDQERDAADEENDMASESSHQGSIDLPDDMLVSGGSHHSRALLDYEQEDDEETRTKQKQYDYEMEMQQEDDRAAHQVDDEDYGEVELAESAMSADFTSENLLQQAEFQNLLEWILDETCVNICTELMETETQGR
uniref:Abnormal spindle-like microcephaly-associated protein ASH domain-containing protein n=1 Tax=Percolomonas cosmopolitus TaxID=63605 RepID=A0A7S1PHR2_9EUKA